jgi:hypothetical protein
MNDQEFMAAFEGCTLANQDFHHAEHVRMAFLYLNHFPVLEALERFSRALERFAIAAGKPNLYHETITWAFLFLIRERMALQNRNGKQLSWSDFAANNPDLLARKSKAILGDYYLEGTLASELARKIFILPDRSRREPAEAKTVQSVAEGSERALGLARYGTDRATQQESWD